MTAEVRRLDIHAPSLSRKRLKNREEREGTETYLLLHRYQIWHCIPHILWRHISWHNLVPIRLTPWPDPQALPLQNNFAAETAHLFYLYFIKLMNSMVVLEEERNYSLKREVRCVCIYIYISKKRNEYYLRSAPAIQQIRTAFGM